MKLEGIVLGQLVQLTQDTLLKRTEFLVLHQLKWVLIKQVFSTKKLLWKLANLSFKLVWQELITSHKLFLNQPMVRHLLNSFTKKTSYKLSFQRGHEGNVSLFSKTQLAQHYIDTLGEMHVGGRFMIIDTKASLKPDYVLEILL